MEERVQKPFPLLQDWEEESVLLHWKSYFSSLSLSLSQVFVEYANAGDSKAAQKMLTGKIFDGKFVVATFYPLSAYKRGYLYQNLL